MNDETTETRYLLFRVAPANEIIGLYSAVHLALAAADRLEPGLRWEVDEVGEYRSGLWRIFPLWTDVDHMG